MEKKTKVKGLIKYNLKTLIGFEIIYKLLTGIIFVPLFLKIFNLIVKVTGYDYLTFENVISFLLNPLTIIMILILLIFMTFYTLIDISTVIIILDCSYQKKKVSIKEAFIIAINKAFKVFKKKNFLITFMIIFLIPFLHSGISAGFISSISIPEFIMDYIIHNTLLSILYLILVVFLIFILLKWLYTTHYFILEDKTFKEARLSSSKLSNKHKIKDLLSIAITQLVLGITYFIFIVGGITLLILLSKVFKNINILGSITYTIIWLFIVVIFVILTLLSTPISYGCISVLYYKHKEKNNEEIKHIKIDNKEIKKSNKGFKIFKYVMGVLVLISCTLMTYLVLKGEFKVNVDYERVLEVTAHRGASIMYPENTMSAFVGAKEMGADWIELDVQQTKDRKIIVLHDTNLKRTTGVNKNTWETTYDEIKDLDAGSFLDEKFSYERIPLFEDVVKFAKENNIKLNIELKPTGNEVDFEKDVIDIINKYSFQDMCVITSQVYEVLENVKNYSTVVKTVYVMSLAYGDIMQLDAADNFSIEASSATKVLVNNVHKAGKELYVWTINTKENIDKMIDLNVDNIITDNITLAKDIINNRQPNNLIARYINFMNDLVKG